MRPEPKLTPGAKVFYVVGTAEEPDVILAVVDLRQDPEIIRQAYKR